MPIAAGSRLGVYEVLSPIGAGGMGEVFRARDTRLNRDVAIKVLPDRLAADTAALARFEREAQAVAALSHPNILAIHDFGTDQGVTYAVTELLEGSTLRDRLKDGALNPRKAIEYGVHIVQGIAAAHERGIVHRDLKPENIFITRDGVVKILDFGLAKSSDATALTQGETKLAETTPGTVLGTVGYMSPEQVRGQTVDHTTDIFSVGAILYEMLTGRRAFKGDSQVETMNAILKEDPPEFSEINPTLPSSLDHIIRRCIEKQPAERFRSAHDLAIALEALSGSSSSSSSASMSAATLAAAPSRRRLAVLPAAAAAALIGALGFGAGHFLTKTPPASAPEYQRLTYRRGPVLSLAIAPDGATIVYSARWEGSTKQLYSSRPGSPESLPLPYVRADVVSISSSGELAIVSNRRALQAYSQVGTLARAPLSGGAARDILEDVQDADWLPDGSSLVVSHVVDDRYRLEFPIGKVVFETGGWISHPRVSPDGKLVAFLEHPTMGDDRGFAAVVDAAGNMRRISGEYSSAQGLAWRSGSEVWFTGADKGSGRGLQAASLDGAVRTVMRVPSNLLLGGIGANGDVLLSSDSARRGIMMLVPGEDKERDLSWLDWPQYAALSSDGKFVLTTEQGDGGGGAYSIYLRKVDGSPAIRLGAGDAFGLSPDDKWVIAQPQAAGPSQLEVLPTGAGTTRMITNDDITHMFGGFLPDGKRFFFRGFKPGRPPRMWIQDLAGGEPKPVTAEGVSGTVLSPDGKAFWIRAPDGVRRFYPIDGSAPQDVTFLESADGFAGFGSDGQTVFAARPGQQVGTQQVFRINMKTGARTLIRVITPPPETLGNGGAVGIGVTPDGRGYIYGYGVTTSDLYLVKGLK